MSTFDENSDIQFTPAAEATLRDALKEISAEISYRAAANAHKGSRDTTLIGVLDVVDALSETRRHQNGLPSSIRSLFGATAVYGVGGFVLLSYSLISGTEGAIFVAGAMLTGVGVPAFTYWTSSHIFRRFIGRIETAVGGDEILQVFRVWLEIESAIRTFYGNRHGESRASAPIVEMVRILLNDGVITSETANKIQQLRKVRNSLAHQGDVKMTKKEARNLLEDAQSVLRNLRA